MTNLIKSKKIKRISAMLLVVLTLFTSVFTIPVSAASKEVTISFDYCYDTAGNIITYKKTTTNDGYTVGSVGEALCRIYADGEEAYCIEAGHTLTAGDTLNKDASATWKSLSNAQRKAVNLALLYGKPGSGDSLNGTDGQKWIATQLIIWEFISGCRSTSTGYKCTNTKFINGICYGDANPGVKSVYNAISKKLANHDVVPSFANILSSKAKTYEMTYKDGKYSVTLTDSNKVLSQFNFKKTDDVTATVSGNKLTLTSTKPIDGTVTFNSAKKMPDVGKAVLVAYGDSTYQDVIIGVENDADPVRAYFKLKTPLGNLKLVKTSEDGVVANIKFKVEGDNYNKTTTTNSKGEFTLNDLTPGTYKVTEITENKYETQKTQTVTVESGKTATVKFDNTLKRGSLKVIKTSDDNFNEGITFNLYGTSLSGAKIDEYATTNADGIAEFNDILISGNTPYTLREVDTDEKYVLLLTQTVVIEWNKVTTKEFHNSLKKGSLKVIKTSDDNFNEGVKFHLYGTSLSGTKVDEYAVTNAEGVAEFKEIPISGNTPYTLEEVDTKDKYITPKNQSVTIEWNKVTNKEFHNTLKKWNLTVTKVDAETKLPQGDATLSGAVYGLYNNGELIDEYTTNEDGSFTTTYYPCGDNWTLKEITPSEGYQLDPRVHHIGAESKNYTVERTNIPMTVTEEVLKGSVVTTKVDEEYPDNKLTGAIFEVYEDINNNKEFDKDIDIFVAELTETDIGEYQLDNLCFGGYFLYEHTAPIGFVKDNNYHYFEIIADNEVVTVENEAGIGFVNTPITGKLEITKKEVSTGNIIPKAGFRIKDENGNTIVEGYTDEKGIAEFTLRYGKYTYEEFDAPDGYIIDTTPHSFEITENNQIIKAEMTNEKEPTPQQPPTGDSSNIGFWIGLGAVALGGLVAVIIINTKRKNDEDD